jgi:hypothetical protein
VAALSGYALALESPQIQPVPEEDRAYFRKIIDERYTPLLEIPHFGQAATTLEILVRTPPHPVSGAILKNGI